MKPLQECQLYAFVDTAYLRGRAPEAIAQQLCDGGADLIQLRAKQSPPDEVRRLAEAILPVTKRAGIALVINDHLSVAQEVGAEFCHLGQDDFFGAGYTQVSQLAATSHRWRLRAAQPQPARASTRDWAEQRRARTGRAGRGRGRGLSGGRSGLSHRHQAHRQTRHAGVCALGGGEYPHPLVRHRRNQS